MRLAWYAGASTALAGSVIISAFHQRANFYSAMVYLFQSNLCMIILVNLTILVYSSFVYGLQRICFGQLRAVEVEQLYEKAWFAVTETCLAMTIFREEVGGFFVVMFVALLTGKVWGWIGEGRIEALEQQPPANPGLFHTRLSVSLLLSLAYDVWLLRYAVRTVILQARADMMVMFLFEFAVLLVTSFHTAIRYIIVLLDTSIVKKQTRQRLQERRQRVREEREEILRRRADGEPDDGEPLPDEEDVDEMDIEVPGWEAKGQYILALDLWSDFLKLCIYAVFFFVLLKFFGLPLHIIRDLFMTVRSFVKRLGALMKYRQAIRDMDKYEDATEEELARENICIICREDMHVWDPNDPSSIERTRPKKLPCRHILHLGCLKSWMERQQVCPMCRRSVVINDDPPPRNNRDAVMFRFGLNLGGGNGAAAAAAGAGGGAAGGVNGAQDHANPAGDGAAQAAAAPGANGNNGNNDGQPPPAAGNNGAGGVRMLNFGPFRLGFAQGGDFQDMAQRLGMPPAVAAGFPGFNGMNGAANMANAANGGVPADVQMAAPVFGEAAADLADPGVAATPAEAPYSSPEAILADLVAIERRIEQGTIALQQAGVEAQSLRAMVLELQRIRQAQRSTTSAPTTIGQVPPAVPAGGPPVASTSFSSQTQQPQAQGQPAQTVHSTIHQQVIHPTAVYGQHQTAPLGFQRVPQQGLNPFIQRSSGQGIPTRLTADPNSPGIPAGSPELPAGVQIPAGWTLIPLHRVDQRTSTATSQATTVPPTTTAAAGPSGQNENHEPSVGAEAATTPATETGTPPTRNLADPSSSQVDTPSPKAPEATSESWPTQESPAIPQPTWLDTKKTDETAVAEPNAATSSDAPNWGGSAQWLNGAGDGASSSTRQEEREDEEFGSARA